MPTRNSLRINSLGAFVYLDTTPAVEVPVLRAVLHSARYARKPRGLEGGARVVPLAGICTGATRKGGSYRKRMIFSGCTSIGEGRVSHLSAGQLAPINLTES